MGNELEIAIQDIIDLCKTYKGYNFQAGYDSPFSIKFHEIMNDIADPYIYFHLQTILLDNIEVIPNETKEELIREIARIKDPNSIHIRRVLIQQCLDLPTYSLKDSALMALSDLDNPLALPTLYKLLQKDYGDSFKKDVQQIVDQLEKTQKEIDAKKNR